MVTSQPQKASSKVVDRSAVKSSKMQRLVLTGGERRSVHRILRLHAVWTHSRHLFPDIAGSASCILWCLDPKQDRRKHHVHRVPSNPDERIQPTQGSFPVQQASNDPGHLCYGADSHGFLLPVCLLRFLRPDHRPPQPRTVPARQRCSARPLCHSFANRRKARGSFWAKAPTDRRLCLSGRSLHTLFYVGHQRQPPARFGWTSIIRRCLMRIWRRLLHLLRRDFFDPGQVHFRSNQLQRRLRNFRWNGPVRGNRASWRFRRTSRSRVLYGRSFGACSTADHLHQGARDPRACWLNTCFLVVAKPSKEFK